MMCYLVSMILMIARSVLMASFRIQGMFVGLVDFILIAEV